MNNKKRIHPLIFASKAIWLIVAMLVVFQIAKSFVSSNYSILIDTQEERCIPEYSVYFQVKQFSEIKRDQIYVFKANGLEPFFEDGTRMGKYIIGVEGDTVEINAKGIFVNGLLKSTGLVLAEKLNRSIESFYTTYQIPENKFFFMGTAERSYDSRYWGLADLSQIKGEAIPLW
ncbi:signal peptidase I [Psychromonas aquimarina]|uniref:signal peptidase I n=1 Tax=Psychromonas aquimarina TaxID=444919 RepID=UPI0003FBC98A|nr:signal peptidase I [Psychromonas aquimarina]